MTRERFIRLFAGVFILVSLPLGRWVNPWWFLLTAFVGINLFQAGLTDFCIMDKILKKTGVKSEADKVCGIGAGSKNAPVD